MGLPSVSVIVINFNGRHHLDACFKSLVQQNYGVLVEIIMVDNGSHDGSVAWTREHYPQVRVIENPNNTGFAPAVNLAANAAGGEYLAFINNDAYAAPSWISELVTTAEAGKAEGIVCVATRVLDWHGVVIDFQMGAINFHGFGVQPFFRVPADKLPAREERLLFANGGAMLIDRSVFLAIGGFDEDYFAYFEDVDLGWRLWVCGYQVVLNPRAVVYHRHHSTASTMFPYQTRLLLERNALATILKNYDAPHLEKVLAPALMLMIKRAVLEGGDKIKREDFDLRRRDTNERFPVIEVQKSVLSVLLGANDIIDTLPQVFAKREVVQAMRRRPDAEILELFRTPLSALFSEYYPYLLTVDQTNRAFGMADMFPNMKTTNVLVMSSDPLRRELAGTGIRAVEMARELSKYCHVTLAAYKTADYTLDGVNMIAFDYDEPEVVENLVASADVIVVQGFLVTSFPFLTTITKKVVVDLYDPFPLGNLEFYRVRSPQDGLTQAANDKLALTYLTGLGDLFLCASEEQRNYWLGALTMAGRLSPEAYRDDRSLRRLIDVAPFGLPAEPPEHTKQVLKGVVPGINQDDTVILWGGGVWEWFDPITVLRAMAEIRQQRPDLKLFFLGKGHPNPRDVPEMQMYTRAVETATELGLLGETVFFNDQWVPYAERANYLLEADIGVSAHFDSGETTLAYRTRILDYLWAGLPMVVSSGDTLSKLVAERGLGFVVAPEDVAGMAQAILALANEADAKNSRASAMAEARPALTWQNALAPLVAYCRDPHYAADAGRRRPHGAPGHAGQGGGVVVSSPELVKRLDHLDKVVEEKNAHIAYLEDLVRKLESGKVMQALGVVKKLRGG